MADHAQHGHTELAASHAANHSPSVRQYVNIFIVLFVLTAVEVAASYLVSFGVPPLVQTAVLVALAALKGALVVMFYMHLRFDSRWFTFFFTAAMILATFGIVIFIILFTYHRGLVA